MSQRTTQAELAADVIDGLDDPTPGAIERATVEFPARSVASAAAASAAGGGGGNGGSQPWTPSSLGADLLLWLKADAIEGLNDDDPVASWPDSSGNGFDAAQATSDNQPIYKTNILNGKPTVRFDSGGPTYLALSGDGLGISAGLDGFTAVAAVANEASGVMFYASINGDDTVQRFLFSTGSLYVNAPNGDADTGPAGGGAIPDPQVYLASWETVSHRIYGAGTAKVQNSAGGPAGPSESSDSDVITIGSDPSENEGDLTGDIGEIFIVNRPLDATERRQAIEYLATKWAIP